MRRLRDLAADWLPLAGAGLAGLGMCTSVPLVYAGYATAGAGALLRWRELGAVLAGWPWAVALSAWLWLTTWLSPYDVRPIPPGFAYCWPALAVWALALSRPRALAIALSTLAAGAAAAVLLAVGQFAIGYDIARRPWRIAADGERLVHSSGFYSHWIRFGDACAIACAWLLAAGAHLPIARLRPRLRTTVVVMAGSLGVLLSGARGALPALVAGIWGAQVGRGWRRLLPACLLAGAVATAALAALAWHQPERVAEVAGGRNGRTYIWQAAWQVFLQRPLTGVGNGAYDQAATAVVDAGLAPRNPEEPPAMGNAHSSYLSLLALHGLPGLLLWFAWLGSVLRAVWQRRQAHPAAWPLALATVLVVLSGGLTEDLAAYASSRFQLFFGLALALGLATAPRDAQPS